MSQEQHIIQLTRNTTKIEHLEEKIQEVEAKVDLVNEKVDMIIKRLDAVDNQWAGAGKVAKLVKEMFPWICGLVGGGLLQKWLG